MTNQSTSKDYGKSIINLIEDLAPPSSSRDILAMADYILHQGGTSIEGDMYIEHITSLLMAIARLGAKQITINFLHSEGSSIPCSTIGGQYANSATSNLDSCN